MEIVRKVLFNIPIDFLSKIYKLETQDLEGKFNTMEKMGELFGRSNAVGRCKTLGIRTKFKVTYAEKSKKASW